MPVIKEIKITNDTLPNSTIIILFISAGFNDIEKGKFFNYCENVTKSLLKIAPFNSMKDHIDIRAFFNSSIQCNPNVDPTNIILSLKNDVEVKIKNSPIIIKGEDIWLNTSIKTGRVVCVVTNNAEKLAFTELDNNGNQELAKLIPYVVISYWPFSPDSVPQYNNPDVAAAHLLAREMGRVFGLGYESDSTVKYEGSPDVNFPNIITHERLFGDKYFELPMNSGKEIEKSFLLPWDDLVKESVRNKSIKYDHPSPPQKNEYDKIFKESMNSIVLLTYPLANISSDGNRYTKEAKSLLPLNEPNLFEGALDHGKGIYRTQPECIMRYGGYDVNGTQSKKKYIPISFCKVCSNYLNGKLGGFTSYKLNGIKISVTCLDPTQKLPSKLANKFVQLIYSESGIFDYSNNNMLCTFCSARRVVHLFETIGWLDFYPHVLGNAPAPPPAWASAYGTNANGEYKLNLPKNSPIVAGVDAQIDACYMHYVWQTAPLELMQNQRFLLKYAALGAPGAVVASGFGVLANKENPNISIQTEMGTRNIHGYKTLTEDDLKTLEPGSVLQLWPNERIYALLLLYFNSEGSFDSAQCVKEAQKTDNDNDLAKLYSMSPNFLPKEQTSKGIKYPAIVGHSMIYMGLVNGRPIAADQHGRTLFLKDDPHQKWLTYLKFWIAAQWYDTDREI